MGHSQQEPITMKKMTSELHLCVCLSAAALLSLSGCGQLDEPPVQTDPRAIFGCGAGPSYTFQPIDFPGAQQTVPVAMNNDGVVSGWYIDSMNRNHGFTWEAGVYTTRDVPGATDTYLVSTYGSVHEGSFRDGAGHVHGFIWDGSGVTVLDVPGSAFTLLAPFEVGMGLGTSALGMSPTGTIVGEYATANGAGHGFILKNGTYTTVNHPSALGIPGSGTLLVSVNESGTAVGRVTQGLPHLFQGFSYKDGVFTTLKPPGLSGLFGNQANGINKFGEIAGLYTTIDNLIHGYVYKDGCYYTVHYPSAPLTELHSINDNGDLTGSWIDLTYSLHGFIARKVP
jgi:uncharacterized membrane protein